MFFWLSVFFTLIISFGHSQILIDSYSNERDSQFLTVPCEEDTLEIKRVLFKLGPNQVSPSIRQGIETLIATKDGEMVKKFDEIGPTTLLFSLTTSRLSNYSMHTKKLNS